MKSRLRLAEVFIEEQEFDKAIEQFNRIKERDPSQTQEMDS